jgi:L-ribulose-5-phosphate 4-epimerase
MVLMLESLRTEVWKCNLELPKQGLVKMTSGNVSGRDPGTGLVVIKPSGYSYELLQPEDLVIVTLEGKVIEGRLKPSVDLGAHLYVYAHRPDVLGIVHTHSTYASIFAALGEPIPACLTASAMLGGEIPVGDYVPIGGDAIGEEIVRKIGPAKAIIMQNHGVFTIGRSATEATHMAVEVEEIAKIVHFALSRGQPALLPTAAIAHTENLYENVRGQR